MNATVIISRTKGIAHSLPYAGGSEGEVHGHSLQIEVALKGPVKAAPQEISSTREVAANFGGTEYRSTASSWRPVHHQHEGQVLGGEDAEDYVDEVLADIPSNLNDALENPTIEHLAERIARDVIAGLDVQGGESLQYVKIWETDGKAVVLFAEDLVQPEPFRGVLAGGLAGLTERLRQAYAPGAGLFDPVSVPFNMGAAAVADAYSPARS